MYRIVKVEALPGAVRALAARNDDGTVVVLVLASLPASEQRSAARRAVKQLPRPGRKLPAVALPSAAVALARAWQGAAAANWAMAGGAVAGGAGMTAALVVGLHPAVAYRPEASRAVPGAVARAPSPSPRAGVLAPGGRTRRGHGVRPGPLRVHRPSPHGTAVPAPQRPVPPSPSPSPSSLLPLPTPTPPSPSPSPTRRRVCVKVLGIRVCVKV